MSDPRLTHNYLVPGARYMTEQTRQYVIMENDGQLVTPAYESQTDYHHDSIISSQPIEARTDNHLS